ncbi:MAG: Maf family protein, partial [Desulfobacterales bacterium]|nr:Maf family protein [Desulfobacterales bacterium]
MASRLILASKSPRRYELLKQVGLHFDVVHSNIEEENFVRDESPRGHVIRLAEEKARDVGQKCPDSWVLGADTVVYIDGIILGKPKTHEEAVDMLRRLGGQEHSVLTGFSVLNVSKGKGERGAVETAVKVKPLSPVEMEWYVQTGEPFDKAGAYAIQGIGSFMIESIRGSYTNVVGLPLCEVIEMLVRLGAISISERG